MPRDHAHVAASVLAIGGLDPSAGAGIGADLRAVSMTGAWGCAACATLTVQSTRGVKAAHPVSTALLAAQVEEVLADLPIRVVKTGALGSAGNIRWVTRLARSRRDLLWVVDPVIWPTRSLGTPAQVAVCAQEGLGALRELCKVATVVTPNVPEAQALLGSPIPDAAAARDAALVLADRGPRAVLLKGGHLGPERIRGGPRAVDWLAVGARAVSLSHRWIDGTPIHGTGCHLAALMAGRLAMASRLDDDGIVQIARWATGRLATMMRAPLRMGSGLLVLPQRREP